MIFSVLTNFPDGMSDRPKQYEEVNDLSIQDYGILRITPTCQPIMDLMVSGKVANLLFTNPLVVGRGFSSTERYCLRMFLGGTSSVLGIKQSIALQINWLRRMPPGYNLVC